jgi:hypothetical protein
MKKSIATGIIFLFTISAVTPIVIGYDVRTSDTLEQSSMPLNRGKTLYVGGSGFIMVSFMERWAKQISLGIYFT